MKLNRTLWTAAVGLALSALGLPAQQSPTAAQVEFFEKKIRPVLVNECYQCHSAKSDKIKGELLLDTKAGTRKGGESGPAVVPRNLKKSLLIEAVRWDNDDLQMPPKKKLPDSVIADLEKWVAMGAPDPRSEQSAVAIKRDIDIEAGKKYWAFQPVKPVAPKLKNKSWPRTGIDRHVLAGLEAKGLRPVADADRRTLIRRVYYDLTGLPPSPSEVAGFLTDTSPKALEKVVDRLLASPQFGERWGRHWLDVARYAESNGMERNAAFPHAWRYRDYVIDSFNADKPFNEFIKEQIAGDLLPGKSTDARRIATGFLAMGPKSLNNRDAREFKMDVVDEQLDVTTRAFMAVTVACARCHDHKFDPIPTEDYYSLAGVFASTQTLFGGATGGGIRHQTKLIELAEGRAKSGVNPKQADNTTKIAALQKRQRTLVVEQKKLQTELKGKAKIDPRFKKIQKETRSIALELRKLRGGNTGKPKQSGPLAMGAIEGKPTNIKVHIRGNTGTLGVMTQRGFPRVLDFGGPTVDATQSGRLQLAEWIAHRDNPLTARVFANRVWHHLFGRGIVRTVDNFGATGERPTNPALLDHLAARFIAQDWSVKKLVREIVLSRTYQMSSAHSAANAKADPDNSLFWKMNQRRLDAESMRDGMLATAGQLNLTPYQGTELAKIAGNLGRNVQQLDRLRNAEHNHRSIYLPVARQAVPDILKAFDFAEPSIIVGRREITIVPTQALFLLNSKFVTEQSKAMAARVLRAGEDRARINLAFQLAFARAATPAEQSRTAAFLAECNTDGTSAELQAWTTLCQALLASAEFRYLN
ncbi:MAG: PSD1 domain-containing protein [Verrucomicrobia subdivision 3 bacterium]|nr:PSD1 domain-containing protein [Limisphaerales bacterium]